MIVHAVNLRPMINQSLCTNGNVNNIFLRSGNVTSSCHPLQNNQGRGSFDQHCLTKKRRHPPSRMGGCIGSPRDGTSPSGDSSDGTGAVSIGRNQPLKPDKPKWKSDVPLTEGQLRSKRDEFWDTAPAFEGRKEIWDALKAAAYALETGDHQLAQAIVDGASISLPHGTLMDCYDELGNRYQLPVYVLSAPTNLIEESSETDNPPSDETPTTPGVEVPVKFYLSTGKEIKMNIRTTDTILKVKRQLGSVEGIDPARQRLFFSGKQLVDKLHVEDAKIHKGYTLQVVITEAPPPTPVDS